LTGISSLVIEYSYYSKAHATLDVNSDSSKSYIEWMKLHKEQTSLRLYTLNYDRIFPTLLSENGISMFEGFDAELIEDSTYGVRPNVNRILRDFDADVCYNLHGCINWDVEELDFHQLDNPEIFFKKYPNLPVNNTPASVQIEKGKTMMVTNIVTGYQKAQKSMIAPFKQMQSAFDIDCSLSDEIYVVGYSFGDEHINESLRTAIRHNSNLKMIIVDPYFMKNDFDVTVSMKLFSAARSNFVFAKTIEKDVHSHMDGTFLVYTMTFEEFRKRQLNPYNKAAKGIKYP
jgi:flagellar assembly factor FliW